MSTISSSTTSTTAYKVAADTTGALVIQTGATPTTAMTVSSSQVVDFVNTPTVNGTPIGGGGGGFSGATTNAVSSSPITLTAASSQYQVAQINSFTNSYVTLPNATTMTAGSNPFVIENRSPYGANLEIRNSAGTVVGYIPIGQIGTIQLVDKSTSAGRWNVEVVNPQTFFLYDANSITTVSTTPVSGVEQGIVGLTSTTFVRWWSAYTINSGTGITDGYLYTQVGTISGSTITFGAIQSSVVVNLTSVVVGSNTAFVTARAVRLSNTAFVVLMGVWGAGINGCGENSAGVQKVVVNTVSGTVVTFGTSSAAGMPTANVAFYSANSPKSAASNGAICRISDTVFALVYNDAVVNTYTWPYNFSGSMACQIVSVSGTTMTIGTKVQLGTSTYSQPLSVVALSATSVFLCYAQAAAAGGSTGRSKLVVISVSGTTPTFGTPVNCETSDVTCFYTGGTGLSAFSTNAAVAPSATQVVFATGYNMGEASVSGTVPTFNSFPYASRLAPLYLSTASKAYTGSAYLSIETGGFVTNTPVTDVLQTNLSVTAATPYSPLGAGPTTAFVAYKDGSTASVATSILLLGTTT